MRLALSCDCADIENFLGRYSHFGAPVKDLSRFSALMERLGNPQEALRCIHIAGTNGKGSVSEYCTCALAAAGYTVGRFTSPYVRSVCERIAAADCGGIREIGCADFARNLNRAADAADTLPGLEFSQFELMNAAAFLYFAEKNTDYVVLEAGIGGTLDSTNIISRPECSVITSIGLDHTKILGSTVGEIARSKCGIIKQGRPAVCAADIPPEAMQVLRERCAAVGAPLIVPDTAQLELCGEPSLDGSRFRYRGREYRLRMGGGFQVRNALTAVEALTAAGISAEAAAEGLYAAQLPARMEFLPERRVLLDGGHNPQAAQAVRTALERCGFPHMTAVIGMMNTKDYAAFLKIILPCFDRVIFADGFSEGSVPAEELRKAAGIEAEILHDPKSALQLVRRDGGLTYFGGSFYFAAAVRKYLV